MNSEVIHHKKRKNVVQERETSCSFDACDYLIITK